MRIHPSIPLEFAGFGVFEVAEPAEPAEPAGQGPVASDTRELRWDAGEKGTGLVTVDTPRSQALRGHVAKHSRPTKNLRAEVETPFCVLTLAALDHQPVSASGKLLLNATARVANSGMLQCDRATNGAEIGTTKNCTASSENRSPGPPGIYARGTQRNLDKSGFSTHPPPRHHPDMTSAFIAPRS